MAEPELKVPRIPPLGASWADGPKEPPIPEELYKADENSHHLFKFEEQKEGYMPNDIRLHRVGVEDEQGELQFRYSLPMGAAGMQENLQVFAFDVFEVNDPYSKVIRDQMTVCALEDPTVRVAMTRRKNAFYADGFHFELHLKSDRHPGTGRKMTPEEVLQTLVFLDRGKGYNKKLALLEDWARRPDINLLMHLREHLHLGVVQGRALTLIDPPLHKLGFDLQGRPLKKGKHQLPKALLRIPSEETGNVIIHRRLLRIIGVRFFSVLMGSGISIPTGMIYTYRNNSGLKRNEEYFGRSDIEPILQLSRINKRIINWDYAKAARTSWHGKMASAQVVDGDEEEKARILQDRLNKLVAADSDVYLYEADPNAKFEVFAPAVNFQMLEAIRADTDRIMTAAMGSTPLKMGRTEQLTRDNATIMETQEIREVRTPDEKTYAEFFERQLLNPLLAYLSDEPLDQLPVEIRIVRNRPVDETTAAPIPGQPEGGDPMMQQKGQEMLGGHVTQQEQNGAFGAAGMSPVMEVFARYNAGELSEQQALGFLDALREAEDGG